MFRLFFGIFSGRYRGQPVVAEQEDEDEEEAAGHHHTGGVYYYYIEEVPPVMSIPLIILAILSVIGGFLGSLSLVGLAKWAPLPDFLNAVSFQGAPAPEASTTIMWTSTSLSVLLALLGFAIAWLFYRKGFYYKESRNPLYRFALNKYYVDEALSFVLIKPILGLGRVVGNSFLEGGVLDGGSRGIARLFGGISKGVRKVQTGYTRNYALGILLGAVLIVLYYAVKG